MKSKALKEQTMVLRPIKALTLYPPNTPATLVLIVLPTKSQVKIHIFTLTQLFSEFDKTYKKRITPTGLTEGETKPRNVISKRNNREAHLDYLRHLKESVEPIRDIVEEAKVELLEYAIGTYPQDSYQRDKKHAPAPLIRKKQVTFAEQCDKSNSNTHKHVVKLNTQKTNVFVPPSTGVNRCTDASGSQPRSNTKKNRISPAKGVNKKQVEEQPRTNKSHLRTTNRVDSSSRPKRDRSRLMNFVKKFIETVRFRNDHFGAIMGYGDYVIGDSVISRALAGLIYTLSSVEDVMKSSPICLLSKASKNKSWLWHRRLSHLNFGTINGLTRKDLFRGLPRLKFEKDHLCFACQLGKSKKHTYKPKTENTNLEVLNTLHMDLCGPMRVQTINGKKYILVIIDDYSRFNWVKFLRLKDETPEEEAVATVCYTQNRSLIHTRHNKTPYELMHNKKPDLTFFRVFGALCYPTNDSEDLKKLQPTADIGIFVGYAPNRKG
nr:hypothetical protein [Tanacetum cinerariifolium]